MSGPRVRRLVLAHFVTAIGEWAATVALLVHAFGWGGSSAVGGASIAMLLFTSVSAPLVGLATARWRAHTVRLSAFSIQLLAFTGAAVCAALDVPSPVVGGFAVTGLAAVTALHPTGAALLPRVARSTAELVSGNLWTSYSDAASALIGSLGSALIIEAGGPEAVFAVCAFAALFAAAQTIWKPAPLALSHRPSRLLHTRGALRTIVSEARARPWSRGVLGVASARNLVLGAFDVLLVLVASEALALGDSGPGYLNAVVGAGALAGMLFTAAAVRGARLGRTLIFLLGFVATACAVLGLSLTRPLVYLTLPLLGLCVASLDALSRLLLQRSNDPRSVGPLFALLGFIAGASQLAGSALAQVTYHLGGLRASFIGLGAFLAVLLIASIRSLFDADEHSDVPVLEMALLSSVPMFASLPASRLESVARAAESVDAAPGDRIVVEGERGNACYIVSRGNFDVSIRGKLVRELHHGDAFGEVALLATLPGTTTVTARTTGTLLRVGRDPFLFALTGRDAPQTTDDVDYESARTWYREVIAEQQDNPQAVVSERAETWIGLGAAGRALGEPSFGAALARAAQMAPTDSESSVLAEAASLATLPGSFYFIAERPDYDMIRLCDNALKTLDQHDPMRARVLANLASHLTFASERERRIDLIEEAKRIATAHADPALIGTVLNAEFISLWDPGTFERRVTIGPEITRLAAEIDDPVLAFMGGFFTAYCNAERGMFDVARQQLLDLHDTILASRTQYFEFLTDRLILSIDIACGASDTMARVDALKERHDLTHADTMGTWSLQVGALAYQAGTLGSMVDIIEAMTDGPLARTWRAALALARLEAGDAAGAAAALAEQRSVPRNYFWITVMQVQSEVAASLGVVDRCEELFESLGPFRGRVGITASGSLCFGLVTRSLGELALALGRHAEAIELLTEAADQADTIGMHFEGVVARRLLATARITLGDHAGAQPAIDEAMHVAQTHSFAREIALLHSLRSSTRLP